MSKQKITLVVDVQDGYELTGEFRGPIEGECFKSATSSQIYMAGKDVVTGPRFIVRKKFTWPKWIKARFIAKNKSERWSAFTHRPDKGNNSWLCVVGLGVYLEDEIFDVQFPDIPWEQSLMENPNVCKDSHECEREGD